MRSDVQDLPRADYDDIELDDDLASLNGVPFTGIVYSTFPDGRLESEANYVEGLPHGLREVYYPDGQLKSRNIAVHGKGSSESWKWHPNGMMAAYRRNVDLRPVELRHWDENGVPIEG